MVLRYAAPLLVLGLAACENEDFGRAAPAASDAGATDVASDTGPTRAAPEVVADAEAATSAIAVGPTGVVWAAKLRGLIRHLEASGPETLYDDTKSPDTLAVSGQRIFWGDVGHATLRGYDVQTRQLAADWNGMKPRVLAASDQRLYWWHFDDATVRSSKLDGSDAKQLTAGTQQGIVDLEYYAGFVYWTATGGGVIRYASETQPVTTIVQNEVQPGAIAVSDKGVFWTTGDGRVRASDVSGADRRTLASGENRPTAVAVDSSGVYWLNLGDGTLRRWTANGVETLASGDQQGTTQAADLPQGIALDATYVYWLSVGDGKVKRLRK